MFILFLHSESSHTSLKVCFLFFILLAGLSPLLLPFPYLKEKGEEKIDSLANGGFSSSSPPRASGSLEGFELPDPPCGFVQV